MTNVKLVKIGFLLMRSQFKPRSPGGRRFSFSQFPMIGHRTSAHIGAAIKYGTRVPQYWMRSPTNATPRICPMLIPSHVNVKNSGPALLFSFTSVACVASTKRSTVEHCRKQKKRQVTTRGIVLAQLNPIAMQQQTETTLTPIK